MHEFHTAVLNANENVPSSERILSDKGPTLKESALAETLYDVQITLSTQ